MSRRGRVRPGEEFGVLVLGIRANEVAVRRDPFDHAAALGV
jgi:hypothetical protein